MRAYVSGHCKRCSTAVGKRRFESAFLKQSKPVNSTQYRSDFTALSHSMLVSRLPDRWYGCVSKDQFCCCFAALWRLNHWALTEGILLPLTLFPAKRHPANIRSATL